MLDGNLASHGTPMRRLIESGAVQGRHFVQVGLRVFEFLAGMAARRRDAGLAPRG